MPKCDACKTYDMNYHLHDASLGEVFLCNRCFLRMDGRLTMEAATWDNYHLDQVYFRHKDSIDRVQAALREADDARYQAMWEMDGSWVKEGAVRR